jgi:acyl carrier protein
MKKQYMDRKEIETKVNQFLVNDFEIDEEAIKEDALLKDDLGIDSLDYVDIVVIVERTFGFKIKPEEMTVVHTLKEFYDYIAAKVNS